MPEKKRTRRFCDYTAYSKENKLESGKNIDCAVDSAKIGMLNSSSDLKILGSFEYYARPIWSLFS